ncbi:MAG: 2-amino-4-hydroxy-6-hydroxymethyldihydropteridine diphosphokinase, partial [Muribaculaceae bacterium]|nr:2-amino-4-hydroxy-6-hydroxymethyldihydropteridine diphosphokinase [Muribaculaceae bacterium]
MPIAHLNIGSNKGDRHGNISLAVSLIDKQAGHVLAVSDPVESAPWGYDSANPFINVGINIDTTLTPFDLLDALQAIERQISPNPHRNPDGTYRDRDIDIDIILYGDV